MNLFQSKKLLLAVVLIILIDQIIQSNLSAINIKRGNFILKQKKFISELYMDKQYFDCVSETRRLLYYYPDIEYYNEYLYFIDTNYFPHAVAGEYWSSSGVVGPPSISWFVDFNDGSTGGNSQSSTYYVRAVRGGYFS